YCGLRAYTGILTRSPGAPAALPTSNSADGTGSMTADTSKCRSVPHGSSSNVISVFSVPGTAAPVQVIVSVPVMPGDRTAGAGVTVNAGLEENAETVSGTVPLFTIGTVVDPAVLRP